MKKIAIIGKPNVGKSSLFNRLIKERDAITSEVAGTTRDFKKRVISIEDREALLIDTGGLDSTSSQLFQNVTEQSLKMAEQSDIIIYMVDGRLLPDDEDRRLFHRLQKSGKKIALVVNKLDNEKLEEAIWEFYSFGVEEIFPLSISHNRKVSRLVEWIRDQLDLPSEEREEQTETTQEEIAVSIIGRVNVGKSSLLNALIKSDRAIVSPVAGTTIDPIDEVIEVEGRKIRFVDTAGIRRRGKIEGIEKYALLRTEKMLERSDIALLVLDASEDFAELDEKIGGLVEKHRLGVAIVLNKWDKRKYEYSEAIQLVRDKFKFLYFAPIITVSALTYQRVHKIYDLIVRIYQNYSRRIPTSQINRVIEDAILRHSLPAPKGRVLKIYYATQFDTSPPQFALIMNRPKLLHFSYKRYLINRIRDEFDFEGSPIVLIAKGKNRGEREEIESDEVEDG
ncbi:MAG TPA: ribosome biogenesis GTPase Der [Campylobacterales bacterium]|nr:ribosome biogenesis GTPase Der [Campylobacterales bacterium]HIO70382.1 ribosome biogenesis GTPase Der [Campylobacterales bacterium]